MNDLQLEQPISIGDALSRYSDKQSETYLKGLEVAERQREYSQFPLYLRILIGIGAVIVGCLLLIALAIAEVFEYPGFVLLIGGAILAIAILLYRQIASFEPESLAYAISQQLSFVGVFMGKCMLVIGAGELVNNQNQAYATFIATLVFTLTTYWVYELYLDRLVSVFVTLFSGFGVIVEFIAEARLYAHMEEAMSLLSVFGYALIPVGVYVFLNPRIPQKYNPFAVAAILVAGFVSIGALAADGIGTSIWPLIFGSKVFHWQDGLSPTLSLSGNVIVTLTCIAVLIWGSGGRESMRNQKIQFGIRIMILVGLMGIAPCMLGILVVLVGYLTNDRLILIAGILYIPTALFFATHTLAIGLMSGGVILVIMACFLFIGYLMSRSWFIGPDLKGTTK
tara:strand:+ start:1487 stop:2671 length:1185 start_codon:yes stop_codon:yes gene_type:complete